MLTVAIDSIDCATAAFAELSADLLKAGVGVRFRARGNSMAPLLRDGDALLVRWVDSSLLIEQCRGLAGVQIDFDRPGLHLLGWAAALRSRWHLNRDWGLYRLTAGALRRLPAFCRHLA